MKEYSENYCTFSKKLFYEKLFLNFSKMAILSKLIDNFGYYEKKIDRHILWREGGGEIEFVNKSHEIYSENFSMSGTLKMAVTEIWKLNFENFRIFVILKIRPMVSWPILRTLPTSTLEKKSNQR